MPRFQQAAQGWRQTGMKRLISRCVQNNDVSHDKVDAELPAHVVSKKMNLLLLVGCGCLWQLYGPHASLHRQCGRTLSVPEM